MVDESTRIEAFEQDGITSRHENRIDPIREPHAGESGERTRARCLVGRHPITLNLAPEHEDRKAGPVQCATKPQPESHAADNEVRLVGSHAAARSAGQDEREEVHGRV